MTPQLQQAIRLLQLSSLELQTEIQERLDSNPLLEAEDEQNRDSSSDKDESRRDKDRDDSQIDASEAMEKKELGDELPMDTQWDSLTASQPAKGQVPDEDYNTDLADTSSENLRDFLLWQLQMCRLSERDQVIAMSIVDSLDEKGYLGITTEELETHLREQELEDISHSEIMAMLRLVQHLEPAGVAASDLQECLLLQLAQVSEPAPAEKLATRILQHHFAHLSKRNYTVIMRDLKLDEERFKEALHAIQQLDPSPGLRHSNSQPDYITPDVLVSKANGQWKVELNPECVPKLGINNYYAGLIKRADNSPDNTYLKDHLQDARWFIKSLQSRHDTLLRVAQTIVDEQLGFFEFGPEAMKPMILHDIAEKVELHESTISRVTTRKYMHTPRGVYELKYFFSSHVSTESGGECSATAIRALIKKLIEAELPKKPLSDNKIATILQDQGINVARRTVAKYREAMAIPTSSQRKSVI